MASSSRGRPAASGARPGSTASRARPAPGGRPNNANVRRARAQQRHRRNRFLAIGAAALVVVVVVVLVIVWATSGGSNNKQVTVIKPADPAVVAQINSVPTSVLLDASKSAANPLKAINGPAQTVNGKPLVLYMGAEYCPYCAATRWPLVMALSKFGTFHNLGATMSASDDVDPNTQTFTFYKSTYTSKYLTFQSLETTTRDHNQVLQRPTASQSRLIDTYDTSGGIPFIYFNGKMILDQSPYDPHVLAGKTPQTIASEIADPNTTVAKNVDAVAGHFVAALCQVTGQQPANVCSATK